MIDLRRVLPVLAVLALAVGPVRPDETPARASVRLGSYLRLDTTNPPGNEGDAAALVARWLGEEGIASERYVTPEGRTSLAARIPATIAGGGTIVLMHHLDVVPAGEGWTVPPFGGIVKDGAIWGRGAIDTKGLGIAYLEAFLEAAKLPERRRGLLYLAVADEEAGGIAGAKFLFERHPELFDGVEAVFGEGGSNRVVLGRTFHWGVEVAQKRPLWLEVTARGRAGHSSSVNPESAAHQLVRALGRALEMPVEWRVTPAARAFFEALAPHDPQAAKVAADLDRIAASGADHPARGRRPDQRRRRRGEGDDRRPPAARHRPGRLARRAARAARARDRRARPARGAGIVALARLRRDLGRDRRRARPRP